MRSRRSIAERVIARAQKRGTSIDHDVEYMALVKQWVEGEIEIEEMRQRYIDVLARRSAERRARRQHAAFVESSQLTAASTALMDTSSGATSVVDVAAAILLGDAAEGLPSEEASPNA
ncbi:hypothetical protein [Rhizobium sp. ERR 1071]|uniref:hypothetical protein n=1 Tax=Rhizobium sp. ERR 1071 TaxID=2572677 RepID=UPI00119F30CF|nr:hypothetical protein [Rhizobium sp. ERR1071]